MPRRFIHISGRGIGCDPDSGEKTGAVPAAKKDFSANLDSPKDLRYNKNRMIMFHSKGELPCQ